MTGLEMLFNLPAARAVQVVEDGRRFEHLARVAQRPERPFIDEDVIDPVRFIAALRPRRVGNRKTQLGMLAGKRLDERRLAGAGRGGDDKQAGLAIAHAFVTRCSESARAFARSGP